MKAKTVKGGVATEWMSADVAQSSGNDAFQQWFARNPKGLDGWLSRMRGKFGKNGDRGK
ncbi:hypothetical protein [Streptomyces sp900105755]|uniref:Uncharacterized protein n=1 Tax=Streptomyces sp. 900105755 TaxID=3154389 RepID=A0ABV1TIB7_9ACTN